MMPGGVLGAMRKHTNNAINNGNLSFSFAGFLPLAFLGLGVYRAWIEIVVMVGVILQGGNYDFTIMYRTALPLMAGALIPTSALGLVDSF